MPNPNAQAELIKNALAKSNINPRTISYIEAHGTGTALGDPIEIRGLQDAFEEYTQDKQFCAIGSVKSNIGHLESAAGISQLTKVLLQMKYKKLVPSIHSEELNPFIDFSQSPFFVQHELTDWQPENGVARRAGISSFGAGGTNIHLIVEEFIPSSNQQGNFRNGPFLFVLSALNPDRLNEYAQKIYGYLQAEKPKYSEEAKLNAWLNQVCFTLQTGREHMPARILIKAHSCDDLMDKLKTYLDNLHESKQEIWVKTASSTHQLQTENILDAIRELNYEKLIQHWINGNKVPWEQLYGEQQPQRISMPTYPFAKRRCWVPSQPAGQATKSETPVLHVIQAPKIQPQNRWLIFSDTELGFHLQKTLVNSSCIYCFMGDKYQEFSPDVFYMNADQPEDFAKLTDHLSALDNSSIKGIIYLWPLENQNSITHLFKAIRQHNWPEQIMFSLVNRAEANINDYFEIFRQLFSNEQTSYKPLYLALDSKESLRENAKIIAQELQQFNPQETHVSYQETMRSVIPLSLAAKQDSEPAKIRVSSLNREDVIVLLFNKLSRLLDLEVREIDPEIPFQNYGLDSIIGINFVAELGEHYPDLISPMDLYRYPTVNQLTDYIVESYTSAAVQEQVVVTEFNNNESEFLDNISHLNDQEISQMLEKELLELENLM